MNPAALQTGMKIGYRKTVKSRYHTGKIASTRRDDRGRLILKVDRLDVKGVDEIYSSSVYTILT